MNILQVGVLGVVGALLALQVKGAKPEYAVYLGLAVSLFLFFRIAERLQTIIETIQEVGATYQVEASYITTLMKMLGVTYVSEFSAAICKDAGHQTIASQIEMFSKLSIMALSLPILLTVLQTIQEFLS